MPIPRFDTRKACSLHNKSQQLAEFNELYAQVKQLYGCNHVTIARALVVHYNNALRWRNGTHAPQPIRYQMLRLLLRKHDPELLAWLAGYTVE